MTIILLTEQFSVKILIWINSTTSVIQIEISVDTTLDNNHYLL